MEKEEENKNQPVNSGSQTTLLLFNRKMTRVYGMQNPPPFTEREQSSKTATEKQTKTY